MEVKFTEEQIMWMEDLVVNKLCPVWRPKKGNERCSICIRAVEDVIERIRKLREVQHR